MTQQTTFKKFPGDGYFIEPGKYDERDKELRFETAKKAAKTIKNCFKAISKVFTDFKDKVSSGFESISEFASSISMPSIYKYEWVNKEENGQKFLGIKRTNNLTKTENIRWKKSTSSPSPVSTPSYSPASNASISHTGIKTIRKKSFVDEGLKTQSREPYHSPMLASDLKAAEHQEKNRARMKEMQEDWEKVKNKQPLSDSSVSSLRTSSEKSGRSATEE
ncbi:MAG: hypothetical protein JSR58_00125 [Verrucomicrobia bacterium]|nr:hypothetical protein [Verrucomicrobiota bacterium]